MRPRPDALEPIDLIEPIDPSRMKLGAALLLGLLILAAASKSVLYDTLDPDFFWHVRVAEQLLRDGVGPIVDDLSFASVKEPWTPYSWLAELAMKWTWNLGGLRGVVAAQSITVAAFFTFLALACLERTRGPRGWLGIALAIIFGGYLALPYFSFRPATMAYALLALCGWLIARDRRMDCRSRGVWFVVPITALLVNVHLFAIFVPVWTGLMWAGDAIDHRRRSPLTPAFSRSTGRARMLFAMTLFACCATPMLPGLVRTMFHYGASDPMVASGVIGELRPFYHGGGVGAWITGGLLLAALLRTYAHRREFETADLLCSIAMLVGMLKMGRLAPLFAIAFTPMLACSLAQVHGKILAKPAVCAMLAFVFAFGVTSVVVGFPKRGVKLSQWLNRNGPDTPGYPCGAAQFVAARVPRRTGRIVNDFNSGGFLAFALGPRGYRVFMDPRTQLYTPQFWERTALAPDPSITAQAIREVGDVDAAVVPTNAPKLANAVKSLGWREVYRDDRASVFVPHDTSTADFRVDLRTDR